jgi:hypothetical protein
LTSLAVLLVLWLAMTAQAADAGVPLKVLAMGSARWFRPSRRSRSDVWHKVDLELSVLDANGLRGPPSGKVSVAYEFAIPDRESCRAEVRAIDPRVEFMPGSRGRIGAGPDEVLCIGHTRHDFRDVLGRLAELPYVTRIIECHFE